LRVLEEKGVFPVYKVNQSKFTRAPLPDFIASSKGLLQGENRLPRVHISDGFYPNAYRPTNDLGYDFSKPTSLWHVIGAKPYRLNHTHMMIHNQGGKDALPKTTFGHAPF